MDISGVILSGGKSTRMGKNKCLLNYKNKTFLDLQIEKLSKICSTVFVSSSPTNKYNYKNIIIDLFNEKGPVSGIFSALKHIETDYAVFLPCDMPFVSESAIKKLIDNRNNYDAVVAVFNKKVYPVFAVYSKKCLSVIENQINKKNYKLLDILNSVNTNFLEFSDNYKQSFTNINTTDDYNNLLNE